MSIEHVKAILKHKEENAKIDSMHLRNRLHYVHSNHKDEKVHSLTLS